MGSAPAEISVASLLGTNFGSGSHDFAELPFNHDSMVFGTQPGRLGTVREVAGDDASGRFADLLDSVEVHQGADMTDSEEKKMERMANTYVALDDKVGWVRRRAAMPDERSTSAERVTALVSVLTGFAERDSETVVTPCVGLTLDSIIEAYEFYNLYSWETGFGIRYAKKQNQRERHKMHARIRVLLFEAISKSSHCQCQAMIRLLRTDDDGWYINEFRSSHNHSLLSTCAEKLHFLSHRHIDKYTRELVSQLRQNNVNLSKVYSIIATFFGRVEIVPFTKRCLRTLCGKLSREQADDDVRKTMAIFSEMKEQDSEFTYNMQVDEDSRIRTLMWSNGRSKTQYHHFGDVVTFDTTYQTNLYDMPFGIFVGVNNHFQSVLYAGVLMRDETRRNRRHI